MRRLILKGSIALAAVALSTACSEAPVTEPGATPEDSPLTSVMPDLAADAGTAGTDRYVPVLERVLLRAVRTVREARGDDAADRIVAEYRRHRRELRAARESGDEALVREKTRRLEGFAGRIGLRVFGPSLVRHMYRHASGQLDSIVEKIRAAAEAGQDVTRISNGARHANRYLTAARTAAGNKNPLGALINSANAIDLLVRLHAAI